LLVNLTPLDERSRRSPRNADTVVERLQRALKPDRLDGLLSVLAAQPSRRRIEGAATVAVGVPGTLPFVT
jgi:hypothetical protein